MTTSARRRPQHRLSGPAELLQAIPYLLGFHPHASLVLLGLDAGELLVTARLDLLDADEPLVLADTVQALRRGGSDQILAAVYADESDHDEPWLDDGLPWASLPYRLEQDCVSLGCELLDVLLVRGGRWRSYGCDSDSCCPPQGWALPESPSAFTAAITVEGVVALDSRAELAASLDPLPDERRHALDPVLAAAEDEAFAARLDGHGQRRTRSVKRALFAAARAFDQPPTGLLSDEEICRFAVALSEIPVRDAVWVAIDDGRLDGRGLWRELARRCPPPYDAAALFLFGWASWRAGNGTLAGIAAERAVAADLGYTAADLLLAAVSRGLDPRRFPKLRLSRPA